MAIAFDAATDGLNNAGASGSLTFVHICTGADRLLFVGVAGDTALDDVTGVTYNGVAMTLVTKLTENGTGSNRWAYLFYLIAPASGAHDVVISAGSTHYLLGGAVSYTGAKQSGVPDAFTTHLGGGEVTAWDSEVTTVADNCWTVLLEQGGGSDVTAGTNSTLRTTDATFDSWGLLDSNGPITPAGVFNMTTGRVIATDSIHHIMASFAPATGGGSFQSAWARGSNVVL